MDRESQPVAWAQFLTELDDAREHLSELIHSLTETGSVSENELRVNLGHVYAHLNRAWHCRDHLGEITEDLWPQFSRFPSDIEPVG